MKRVNIFGARKKEVAKEEAAAFAEEFAAEVAVMRLVAMEHRNTIDVVNGEDIHTKIGVVPQEPGEPWVAGQLAPLLAKAVMLPGWTTHIVFIFSCAYVRSAQGGVERVEHLSATINVPIEATTEDLRPLKDAAVAEIFSAELLALFFPGAPSVISVIRAGELVYDDDGETWTPVIFHFYAPL